VKVVYGIGVERLSFLRDVIVGYWGLGLESVKEASKIVSLDSIQFQVFRGEVIG